MLSPAGHTPVARGGEPVPSEHCSPKHREADQPSPASGQQSQTVGASATAWMSPEEPVARLSRWHESEDGQEQPLKASPSTGPRSARGVKILSETWGLRHSRHEGLRLRWEEGLSSFLMGKVMLSMNTHPLPHSLVSVETHSKPPDLIEQMLPASPSHREAGVL